MEFPILQLLPLPSVAARIVTQFLRPGSHPTALMIEALTFKREPFQEAIAPEDDEFGEGEDAIPASLRITGTGIRQLDLSLWPPQFVVYSRITSFNALFNRDDMIYSLCFSFDETSGESNYKSLMDHSDFDVADDEDDEEWF